MWSGWSLKGKAPIVKPWHIRMPIFKFVFYYGSLLCEMGGAWGDICNSL